MGAACSSSCTCTGRGAASAIISRWEWFNCVLVVERIQLHCSLHVALRHFAQPDTLAALPQPGHRPSPNLFPLFILPLHDVKASLRESASEKLLSQNLKSFAMHPPPDCEVSLSYTKTPTYIYRHTHARACTHTHSPNMYDCMHVHACLHAYTHAQPSRCADHLIPPPPTDLQPRKIFPKPQTSQRVGTPAPPPRHHPIHSAAPPLTSFSAGAGGTFGNPGAATAERLSHAPLPQSPSEYSALCPSRCSSPPTPSPPSSPQRPPAEAEESISLANDAISNTACLLEDVLTRPRPSPPGPRTLLRFRDRFSRWASIGISASELHGRTLSPRTCVGHICAVLC